MIRTYNTVEVILIVAIAIVIYQIFLWMFCWKPENFDSNNATARNCENQKLFLQEKVNRGLKSPEDAAKDWNENYKKSCNQLGISDPITGGPGRQPRPQPVKPVHTITEPSPPDMPLECFALKDFLTRLVKSKQITLDVANYEFDKRYNKLCYPVTAY